MKLAEIATRRRPTPWSGESKIPWHEAGFSRRMLREHLSQAHDRASRRLEIIDEQVAWIHEHVLASRASRILDLGCGPGLYTTRLAKLGHGCTGIDFSPASISHARSLAEREAVTCEYRLEDLLGADFGSGLDLVLLIFGELNTFPSHQARQILAKASRALSPSGVVLLECHSDEYVRSAGRQAPSWFSAAQSVFSDQPHVCLKECSWHPTSRAATEEYFVISLDSAGVTHYVSTMQSYDDAEYSELFREAALSESERHPCLTGRPTSIDPGLSVRIAGKRH